MIIPMVMVKQRGEWLIRRLQNTVTTTSPRPGQQSTDQPPRKQLEVVKR
jgi:hypothetical protein